MPDLFDFSDLEDFDDDKPKKRGRAKEPEQDPLDLSDLEDLEEDTSKPISVEVGDAVISDGPKPAPEPEREPAWYDGALDKGIAFLGGATANLGDEAAAYVARLDPRNADIEIDDLIKSYEGEQAKINQKHPYYHGAGSAALGLGAAALAGPGVGAQAAMGAGVAGVSEMGDSGDPLMAGGKALLGGAVSGAAAGIGGLAARMSGKAPAAAPVAAAAPRPQVPQGLQPNGIPFQRGLNTAGDVTMDMPAAAMPQAAPTAAAGDDSMGKMLSALGDFYARSPTGRAIKAGSKLLGKFGDDVVPNESARNTAIFGTEGAAELMGSMWNDAKQRVRGVFNSAADDVEKKAYATGDTVNWALKSVLGSGATGLPPDDERKLNESLFSGDTQNVVSNIYQLQQKFPQFAKRYESALRKANGEDE